MAVTQWRLDARALPTWRQLHPKAPRRPNPRLSAGYWRTVIMLLEIEIKAAHNLRADLNAILSEALLAPDVARQLVSEIEWQRVRIKRMYAKSGRARRAIARLEAAHLTG